MKPATKRLAGWSYRVSGLSHLLEDAVLEDRNPVAHRHGLDLVVRHVDGGDTEPGLQGCDLGAGGDAELGVQVAQRLVHQEDLRLADDGTTHGDPLALAAGECLRLAGEERLEAEEVGGFQDPGVTLGLGDASHLQGEAHVVGDGHVRVQRVVLEHHGDVPVLRGQVGDVAIADHDLPGVHLFEASEHAQRGGLAATGGSDQHHELAVPDLEVQLVDGWVVGAGIDPGRILESDCGHAKQHLSTGRYVPDDP